jgi:RNA polymerase sigma-70 factor (ECF subfamily)
MREARYADRSMEDEARALERFLGGDEAAFEDLVTRYESKVRTLAYGILRDRGLAEDVAQETFLTAHQKARSFRGDSPASFRSWLFRIAVNRARDELRRKSRRGEVELDESEAGRDAPWDQRLDLSRAIAEIRPEHRTALILREVEGLSYAEIAEALGWPAGTVMTRIHRARLELRALLSEKKT